jgi:hypothetical protein
MILERFALLLDPDFPLPTDTLYSSSILGLRPDQKRWSLTLLFRDCQSLDCNRFLDRRI